MRWNGEALTLTRFEALIDLVNDVNTAAATYDTAIFIAGLHGL